MAVGYSVESPTEALTLWGRDSAFNVQKVLWLLDELELEYRHINLGGDHGGLDDPEFLAMNPHGRVPVLRDGSTVIWESHAILRYLAARYGGEFWWPSSLAERACRDGWMDWAQTALQPAFMALFWSYFRTPQSQHDPDTIGQAREACETYFRLLNQELMSRPYLGGDRISLADIPAGTVLYRYFEMGLPVARGPAVMAWYQRLADREPYRQRIQVCFEPLRGKLTY
ncbi:glutathione S-transferase [Alcanivorax xiamenensis]|uniref:Glutathione S-transferase n=1 Tax=Alcanivorax xiamenensis TaxID=1177156 RepID=A0ABQ6Y3S2_9GAMM|nr:MULTISPECIES: glutathione S-transferase family protein [Alcanivorax]KAF0802693.1 glutathione S-transferase [Alcanivorax xiamenensis]